MQAKPARKAGISIGCARIKRPDNGGLQPEFRQANFNVKNVDKM